MSGELLQDPNNLQGILEGLRFESEDRTFSVAKVKTSNGEVTVVGNLRGARPGERLVLSGRWEHNNKFGTQFRVVDVVVLPPASREGIEAYLGSGLIDGIGPVLAKRLVSAFGDKTLDVIENDNERLLQVPGIGQSRQKQILAAWDLQRTVRQIMVFLSGHGISPAYAQRILKTYGDRAIQVVRENPYQLARDVFGIGFKIADKIAQHSGIENNDPKRIAAGLEWTLEQGENQGHTFLPQEPLIERTVDLLQVDREAVENSLKSLLKTGHLVSEPEGSIYTKKNHQTECELANHFARMLNHPFPSIPLQKLRAVSKEAEKRLSIQLDPAQKEAVNTLLSSRFGVLTGGPGTGKTTIVRIFADTISSLGGHVLLAAPTGRAARRLSEMTLRPAETLHKLLQFSFAERKFMRDQDNPLEAHLIIVDESSMLDQALARALLRAVSDKTALLLVGDADQLPSVGPGNVLKDVLLALPESSVRLTQVFRQAADSEIVRNAHRICSGLMPLKGNAETRSEGAFFHVGSETALHAQEQLVEVVCNRLPEAYGAHPVNDIQVLSPMHRGDCGIEAINRTLQQRLNPAGEEIQVGERVFRVGDKLIQLRNDYQKEVFNGEIGRLFLVDRNNNVAKVQFDGRLISYELRELYQLALAYCISIHKSQGSEFPLVVIPITTQHHIMLQKNLIYTAITRARNLVCVIGQPSALRRAVTNDQPMLRYTGLKRRLKALVSQPPSEPENI